MIISWFFEPLPMGSDILNSINGMCVLITRDGNNLADTLVTTGREASEGLLVLNSSLRGFLLLYSNRRGCKSLSSSINKIESIFSQ